MDGHLIPRILLNTANDTEWNDENKLFQTGEFDYFDYRKFTIVNTYEFDEIYISYGTPWNSNEFDNVNDHTQDQNNHDLEFKGMEMFNHDGDNLITSDNCTFSGSSNNPDYGDTSGNVIGSTDVNILESGGNCVLIPKRW